MSRQYRRPTTGASRPRSQALSNKLPEFGQQPLAALWDDDAQTSNWGLHEKTGLVCTMGPLEFAVAHDSAESEACELDQRQSRWSTESGTPMGFQVRGLYFKDRRRRHDLGGDRRATGTAEGRPSRADGRRARKTSSEPIHRVDMRFLKVPVGAACGSRDGRRLQPAHPEIKRLCVTRPRAVGQPTDDHGAQGSWFRATF